MDRLDSPVEGDLLNPLQGEQWEWVKVGFGGNMVQKSRNGDEGGCRGPDRGFPARGGSLSLTSCAAFH